jgi:hypothetical protein
MKSKHRRTVSRKHSKPSTRRLLSAARLPSAAPLLSAPRLFSAEDALKPPPALQWCVQDLFPRPSLNMLVGGSGSKKTLLAIDLAVCVALGKPWLRHPVAQGAVLFLDEQSGPLQFWTRLNSAFAAHAVSPQTPLLYSSMSALGLKDKSAVDALIKRCCDLGVHLIIFDSFTNFLRGGESSLASLQPALFNLRRLAESCHAAVLVIHHTNRLGALHGSTLIPAAFDLLLSIESEPGQSSIKVSVMKSRFQAPPAFFARAIFENDLLAGSKVSLKHSKDPADVTYWWHRCPYASDSAEFRILKQLDYRSPLTYKEIHLSNGWLGPRKLRNAIQILIDVSLVVRENEGKQGRLAEYALVNPLEQVWPDEDA